MHSLGRVRAAAVQIAMIAEMREKFDHDVKGYEQVMLGVVVMMVGVEVIMMMTSIDFGCATMLNSCRAELFGQSGSC